MALARVGVQNTAKSCAQKWRGEFCLLVKSGEEPPAKCFKLNS
jgi:hypothetical protein